MSGLTKHLKQPSCIVIVPFICICVLLYGHILRGQTRLTGSQIRILSNTQTSTSYNVSASDCGTLLSFSNTSAITVLLPSPGASGLGAGCWFNIQNTGTGLLTIVPTQSTIDGSPTLELTSLQGLQLVSSGAAYLTERGSSAGLGNCALVGTNSDQLTCGSLSTKDPSTPGQVLLYDTQSSANSFGWAAPPSVISSYTAQVPAAQPNGQVMQFSSPDGITAIATGEWITLGPLAIQTSVLSSQLPKPTTSTLGGVEAIDCTGTGYLQKINTDGSTTCAAASGDTPSPGIDGQVYTSDSTQPSNPGFESTPFSPLPGLTDSAWSSYGTNYGTTVHTQITSGSRVILSNNNNAPEVHGRYIPVSPASDFTHTFGIIGNFGGNYNGQDIGVFFTDGTQYSACAMHGSSGNSNESITGYYGAASTAWSPTNYPLSPSAITFPWNGIASTYWQLNWVQSTHTMTCQVSVDGFSWLPLWTDSKPQLTPTGVGYYVLSGYGSPTGNFAIAWGYR